MHNILVTAHVFRFQRNVEIFGYSFVCIIGLNRITAKCREHLVIFSLHVHCVYCFTIDDYNLFQFQFQFNSTLKYLPIHVYFTHAHAHFSFLFIDCTFDPQTQIHNDFRCVSQNYLRLTFSTS